MPNKYYLREDRKAVKPTWAEPKGPTDMLSIEKMAFIEHLQSLPALDVDQDYLKTLRPGWFEGKERYEVLNIINGKWESRNHNVYANNELKLRRILIVAPQEAEKRIGADNICPETKELCLDECCSPGSVCNVSGSKLQPADKGQEDASPFVDKKCIHCGKEFRGLPDGSYCSITCWDSHCLHGVPNIEQPATPQPVTGEDIQEMAKEAAKEYFIDLYGESWEMEYNSQQTERKLLEKMFLAGAASSPTDAVEFAEWLPDNAYRIGGDGNWWKWKMNDVLADPSGPFTTQQLYKLFKKTL